MKLGKRELIHDVLALNKQLHFSYTNIQNRPTLENANFGSFTISASSLLSLNSSQ